MPSRVKEMGSIPKEQFPDKRLQELITFAKDYAFSHGVIIRSQTNLASPDLAIHVPFTLFPSPFPRRCYQQAVDVQVDFNLLMHRISHDKDFLEDSLRSVLRTDDFVKRLFDIHDIVTGESLRKPVALAMNRSDYMVDRINDRSLISDASDRLILSTGPRLTSDSEVILRQVEFNTIAAGMAGLSQRLYPYHSRVLEDYGLHEKTTNVPINNAVDGLAEAIVKAYQLYGNAKAVVLFLVYNVDYNVYDQRWLEYSIMDLDNRVKVIRRTLTDIRLQGHLSADNTLFVDGLEIAIVYQRSCYSPEDFLTDDAWQGRMMLEQSKAIICPSVGYHLAGTKKVQQVLAQPGVVERFIEDKERVKRIRETFARQYSLDMNEDGDRNVAMAMNNPTKFVLKPQREGGGNNVYGEDIRTLLTKIGDTERRSSYILMERLDPMVVVNYPVTSGQDVQPVQMTSELGIFGTLVGTRDEIFLNQAKGYLMRTKKIDAYEGGVSRGCSVLDSPSLFD